MDAHLRHIAQLLEALKEKTGQEMTNKGFKAMAEMMNNGIEGKYLYDNLDRGRKLAVKRKEETIGLNETMLDKVAVYLGFPSYRRFCEEVDHPLDDVLLQLEGAYYSYVRRNSTSTVIFRSPVRIWEEKGKMKFQLQGPQWKYEGDVILNQGCLFILMRSAEGKEFHHVYKIGKRRQPHVLQGIFSGVSTSFDPIGGRTLLIRQDTDVESLTGREYKWDQSERNDEELRRVATYFEHYDKNNLSIEQITTFGLDDLG